MKREILLSPACRAPQLWGYTGEKEHTRIIVELPEDIAACNFYRAKITIKGKLFRTDYLEILDGKVCFELTSAMVETSGIITAQIIGYVVDENGDIDEIGKTEIYRGNIKKSLSGKLTPADSDPSLLDRILAKVHVLLEKMHSHNNTATLDKFGETSSGGLLFGGKDIGGIKSLTSFPETAAEGDVVLLHRCNEISSDDSNSGVVLDTAALASLKLPEGITHRRWEFEAPNPTGKGFILVLEQDVIEEDEPYELTGIFLLSENYGGRWYWRDGKPYDGISNVSSDPIPALIPLGKVSGFTVTKDLMFGLDFFDVEDTDNTTIFRTVPREYMYSGGEWKLTERTDIAEGNLISDFGEIEKDGQKFYRLNLTDSRNLKNRKKKTVDIPIESVKKITSTVDGITLESEELDLGIPKESSGGIKSVTALPETANEGDVVYYCPLPNRLTAADSGHKVYVDMNGLNRVFAYMNSTDFNPEAYSMIYLPLSEEDGNTLQIQMTGAELFIQYIKGMEAISDGWLKDEGEEVRFRADYSTYSDYDSTCNLPHPIWSFDIGAIDEEYMNANKSEETVSMPEFSYFRTIPRFYRYTNGEWVELPYSETDLPNEVDCTLTDTSLTYGILPNILYRFGEVDRLNLDLLLPEDNKVDEYKFSFISGETATVLTLPSSVKWVNELTVEANKRYEISVVDNVALWCAVDYEVTE